MKSPFVQISSTLKVKREQLLAEMASIGPLVFMQQHAGILDDYFRESFENSMVGPTLALYKNPCLAYRFPYCEINQNPTI